MAPRSPAPRSDSTSWRRQRPPRNLRDLPINLGIAQTLGDFWLDGDADASKVMAEMLKAAEDDGQAFLARVSDCASLAKTAHEMPDDRMGPCHAAQASGYCLLWEIKLVRETLERSEDEARALLEGWAARTRRR